jgi:hypothetical protein
VRRWRGVAVAGESGEGPEQAGLGDGGEVAGEFVGEGDVVVGDVPTAGGGHAAGEDDGDGGVGAGQAGFDRSEQEPYGDGGIQGAQLVAGVVVEAAAEQGGQGEGELDRDERLLAALSELVRTRSSERIDVAVVYGARHVPAIVRGLADRHGYRPRTAEWLTVLASGRADVSAPGNPPGSPPACQ